MIGFKNRKDRIIEAAIDCFTKKGEAATISEISIKAGIPGSTVYRLYKSKDEMLLIIFDYFWEELLLCVKGAYKGSWEERAIGKIQMLIAILQNFLDQNLNLFRVVVNVNFLSLKDAGEVELREKRLEIERKKQEAISLFDELIKEGQDEGEITKKLKPQVIRQILVGSSLVLVKDLYLKPGIEKRPADIREGINFLLNFIKEKKVKKIMLLGSF